MIPVVLMVMLIVASSVDAMEILSKILPDFKSAWWPTLTYNPENPDDMAFSVVTEPTPFTKISVQSLPTNFYYDEKFPIPLEHSRVRAYPYSKSFHGQYNTLFNPFLFKKILQQMVSSNADNPDYSALVKTEFWDKLRNEEIKDAFNKGFRDLDGAQALGVVLLMAMHQMEREWLGAVDPNQLSVFKIPPGSGINCKESSTEGRQIAHLRDLYASQEFNVAFGSPRLDQASPAPSLLAWWSPYHTHTEVCRIILEIIQKSKTNSQERGSAKLNLEDSAKSLQALQNAIGTIEQCVVTRKSPVPLWAYTKGSETSRESPYQAATFSGIFMPLAAMSIFDIDFEKDLNSYKQYVKHPIEMLMSILIDMRDSPAVLPGAIVSRFDELDQFLAHTFLGDRHNMLALDLIIGHVNAKINRIATFSKEKKEQLKLNASFCSELKLDTVLTAKDMLYALGEFFDNYGEKMTQKPIILKREDAHFLLNYLYELFGWKKPLIMMTRIIEFIGDRQDLHQAERHRVSCQQEVKNMLTYLEDLKSKVEAYAFTNIQGNPSWQEVELKALFNDKSKLTKNKLLDVLRGLHKSYLARQQLGKNFVLNVFYFEPHYTEKERKEFINAMTFRTAILKSNPLPKNTLWQENFEASLMKIFINGPKS